MDFSESLSTTTAVAATRAYVAHAVEYRLCVRDAGTLGVVQLFSCLDRVVSVDFSPDGTMVMARLVPSRSMVQVFKVDEPDWTAKVDEGAAGIANAIWTPDSRGIITFAEFGVRLSAWNLSNKAVTHIHAPKLLTARGVTFSPQGNLMALAERRDTKDFITVFRTSDWEPAAHFPVATTDLQCIQWSPDGAAIAVADHVLDYKLLVYAPDGKLLADYKAYEDGLGIRTMAWSPSGQMLAVGSYDGVCRVLNHVTWKAFAEWSHATEEEGSGGQSVLREPDGVVVYRETSTPEAEGGVAYVVDELPVGVDTVKPQMDKPNPKLGVCAIGFSSDGAYCFTRNEHMPCALWIWDMKTLELASLLIQRSPITSASWDAAQTRLLLTTAPVNAPDAPRAVYMWTPDGCSCIPVPNAGLVPGSVAWNPNAAEEASFVLTDAAAQHFACGFCAA